MIEYVLEGGEEWNLLDALKKILQSFISKNTSKTEIHSWVVFGSPRKVCRGGLEHNCCYWVFYV